MPNKSDILIIGGGAAGFFTAINAAEQNPELKIIILERGKEVLTKVKVSGGGRCNVTHAKFLPKELTQNYPRGEKELLGPFHSFMTGDTIEWFSKRGVELKIEEDGRMFPATDSSQTIIDCFISETERLGVDVLKGQSVKSIEHFDSAQHPFWKLGTLSDEFSAEKLVIATGSNPKIWKVLESLEHTIVPPVPSLFTFNIDDKRIKDLPGLSTEASVKILNENKKTILESEGPLLITHWGMSGPAILKLSAWGARLLEPTKYHFRVQVNWLLDASKESISEKLKSLKIELAKKTVLKNAQFDLPKRLWQSLVDASDISETTTWADISKEQINNLASQLTESRFNVHGKSTFKEEFVTAGGVKLKEVDFKTLESKKHKNLYFAGEVLNIDAITGGFNFQNAWTGGYLVAQSIAK
ncbi:BaiN/RdsA family NAD(P)/FAD-dependent oxidoreductase [Marixanthomonas ophiurae]|uniref:NAD(P)/FAD-dependent oxidoreductase n=1 Tax=Marixanthomonas ophiurae TaxID=387659 RepID=A0A3E1Q9N5_9FLAO|nr:NAD(P)/FAD-dependent oxidoreductase [Marixanthomonas ophiurae]RFN58848.1 NAD(P)/FAD-dependent oxidoreductase [Marixanthomonas ophiurae]